MICSPRVMYPAIAVIAILGLIWLSSGSGNPGLTIAVIGPLTGSAAQYGLSHKNGAQLALDQVNKAGGINGKQLSAVFLDDQNNKITAAEVGRDAIYKHGAIAIIGAISSDNTMNLQRICEKAQIPLLTAVSTNPFITRVNHRYSFRCLSDDNVQAEELAKYTARTQSLRRVAIVHDNNKYGSEGARTYMKFASQAGQTIVANEGYDEGTMNFRTQLERVKAANPDGLLIWGLFYESALCVRQAREMGIQVPIFGPDAMAISSFLDISGINAEGIVLTYPFHSPRGGEIARRFLADYRTAYGFDADSFAAHGYDAMNLVLRAFAASDGSGPGLREALSRINQYDGVTGRGGFDANGNETRPVQLAMVKNGQFVPLTLGGN